MARNPPKTKHVKHVIDKRTGKNYPYFNTGQKKDGKVIYIPLPQRSAANFWDVYYALCAARTKRERPAYTVASLFDEYLASQTFARLAGSTQANYRVHAEKMKAEWGSSPPMTCNQATFVWQSRAASGALAPPIWCLPWSGRSIAGGGATRR